MLGQIVVRNSWSRSSESLPRAAIKKVSPCDGSKGSPISVAASRRAVMPEREVKATAEKECRMGGRR